MPSNPLKVHGFIYRSIIGLAMSGMFVGLGIVIPLWPITLPLCLIAALVTPFIIAFGYLAEGKCPYCGVRVTVTKRMVGMRCKKCQCRLFVRNDRLIGVDEFAGVDNT